MRSQAVSQVAFGNAWRRTKTTARTSAIEPSSGSARRNRLTWMNCCSTSLAMPTSAIGGQRKRQAGAGILQAPGALLMVAAAPPARDQPGRADAGGQRDHLPDEIRVAKIVDEIAEQLQGFVAAASCFSVQNGGEKAVGRVPVRQEAQGIALEHDSMFGQHLREAGASVKSA
jgi:hypothetical protein